MRFVDQAESTARERACYTISGAWSRPLAPRYTCRSTFRRDAVYLALEERNIAPEEGSSRERQNLAGSTTGIELLPDLLSVHAVLANTTPIFLQTPNARLHQSNSGPQATPSTTKARPLSEITQRSGRSAGSGITAVSAALSKYMTLTTRR